MYTKDNIDGLLFSIGISSHYVIRKKGDKFKLYSQPPEYNNDCGESPLDVILSQLKSNWKVTGKIFENYEIY